MSRHSPKSLWRYVRMHHAEFGAALFVVPVLAIAFVLVEAAYALSWLVS
ncbi:MAG TPA: hypothetical protein VIO33_16155 [Burkholderiaceae bacterium]